MLSDPKRVFIEQLGAKSGNGTTRSHFIFERGTGKLLHAQINVKADDRYASFSVQLVFSASDRSYSHRLALEFIKGL